MLGDDICAFDIVGNGVGRDTMVGMGVVVSIDPGAVATGGTCFGSGQTGYEQGDVS